MADAADRRATHPAHTLRQDVYRREDRFGVVVEEQVILAEVRAREMPVEVLRLHVQGKCVRDERIERLGDRLRLLRGQIGFGGQLFRRGIRLHMAIGLRSGRVVCRLRRHDIPFSTGLFASLASPFHSRSWWRADDYVTHRTIIPTAQNMPPKQADAPLDGRERCYLTYRLAAFSRP